MRYFQCLLFSNHLFGDQEVIVKSVLELKQGILGQVALIIFIFHQSFSFFTLLGIKPNQIAQDKCILFKEA